MASSPAHSCTEVTTQCPVSATQLTYRPDLAANVFFLVVFALCAIVQAILGIRYKTWTFMITIVLGCLSEVVGYLGRIILSNNPWSNIGFTIQLVFLIFAPVFIAAGIYLTLKHLVLEFGERYSLLRPAKLYTWIFISADVLSLLMQAAGAAMAASSSSVDQKQTGSDIALAGIIFQVIALLIFALLCALYFVRVYRDRTNLVNPTRTMATSTKFRSYLFAIGLATVIVFIRCVYRIFELGGSWRNSVFRSETDFIALDGVMITVAVLALTIAHPGFCFGGLSKGGPRDYKKPVNQSDSGPDVELLGGIPESRISA